MCGIAGVFSPWGEITSADLAAVRRMTDAQVHRGPDGEGYFADSFTAFGHRRLSIIDLSDAGAQPFANEDGTVRVVFNGEIYNYLELTAELRALGHVFASASDTEVLVHGYEQWGMAGMLPRLRGMFAFALYDSGARRWFVARDRFGIKPLYYALGKTGELIFASEVKALLESGLVERQTDPEAIAGYLLFGSIPHPRTWQSHVKCLEPAHFAEFGADGIATVRYWVLTDDRSDNMADVLQRAVTEHLISAAPLGLFLSSGVDSNALAALAKRAGTDPLKITFRFDKNARTDWRAFLDRMDQPAHDGLNTWLVSGAARALGIKTAVSGVAADEVFWGYRHQHRFSKLAGVLRMWRGMPAALRQKAAGLLRLAPRHSWSRLEELADPSPGAVYYALRGFLPLSRVERLTGLSIAKLRGIVHGISDESAGDERSFQLLEMKRYLHDQLLRDADTFGMAASLEVRVPFLDHRVVESAFAHPGLRIPRKGMNKPVLVDAVNHSVVTAAAARPKEGFTLPLENAMRTNRRELRERAMSAVLVDQAEVKLIWRDFEEGRVPAAHAWALTALGGFA